MLNISAGTICEAIDGVLLQGDRNAVFSNISIDSRYIEDKSLFAAIKGNKTDGHKFIASAIAAGATGVIVENNSDEILSQLSASSVCILVKNTLQTLQELAAYVRRQLDIPCIGITGSNGKTSTKDILTALLSERWNVLCSRANNNNELGLPLSVLKASPDHQIMVLEMGMRGMGQIDFLCRIARPDIAVITNVYGVHLELLHTVENIAKAKGEILDHIDSEGLAVINGDIDLLREQAWRCRGQVICFGLNENNDFQAHNIQTDENGSSFDLVCSGEIFEDIEINIPGKHNVINALAAIAVARYLGLSMDEIRRGLKKCILTSDRLEIFNTGKIKIINDTYNANPVSVCAALEQLTDVQGKRKIAVLADMYELGDQEKNGHLQVGHKAAELKIDRLIAVGKISKNIAEGAISNGMLPENIAYFQDKKQAAAWLKQIISRDDVILVKGSRGMGMEYIVNFLKEVFV